MDLQNNINGLKCKVFVIFTTSYISEENYTQILEYVKALMKSPSNF